MFTRVHHVAIAVRSLGEALRFYRDALGLGVAREATLAEQGVRAALLPVGADEIELLEAVDPAGGVARYLERRGEGLHHVCLETPDIAAALAAVKASGLPLIDQRPRAGLAGRIAFLHPKASAGVLIEMAEPDEPAKRAGSSGGEPSWLGFGAVYIAAQDPGATAASYVRNFRARTASSAEEREAEAQELGSRTLTVWIGASRAILLGPEDSTAGARPVARFLAERGEGLFGVALRASDLARACQQLGGRGVPIGRKTETDATPLVRIDPSQAHGATLFLLPSGRTRR